MLGVVVVGAGGGGLELRLSPWSMEELDAVDGTSLALTVVSLGSLGFEALVFESIPVERLWATLIVLTSSCSQLEVNTINLSNFLEGAYAVSRTLLQISHDNTRTCGDNEKDERDIKYFTTCFILPLCMPCRLHLFVLLLIIPTLLVLVLFLQRLRQFSTRYFS